MRCSEIAQCVAILITKPDYLCLVPVSQMYVMAYMCPWHAKYMKRILSLYVIVVLLSMFLGFL